MSEKINYPYIRKEKSLEMQYRSKDAKNDAQNNIQP